MDIYDFFTSTLNQLWPDNRGESKLVKERPCCGGGGRNTKDLYRQRDILRDTM